MITGKEQDFWSPTRRQINMLAYIEESIKNMKTREQEIAIELEKERKRKQRRKEMQEIAKREVANEPKAIWLNYTRKFMKESDLTDEIIEKEVQFAIEGIKKDS